MEVEREREETIVCIARTAFVVNRTSAARNQVVSSQANSSSSSSTRRTRTRQQQHQDSFPSSSSLPPSTASSSSSHDHNSASTNSRQRSRSAASPARKKSRKSGPSSSSGADVSLHSSQSQPLSQEEQPRATASPADASRDRGRRRRGYRNVESIPTFGMCFLAVIFRCEWTRLYLEIFQLLVIRPPEAFERKTPEGPDISRVGVILASKWCYDASLVCVFSRVLRFLMGRENFALQYQEFACGAAICCDALQCCHGTDAF